MIDAAVLQARLDAADRAMAQVEALQAWIKADPGAADKIASYMATVGERCAGALLDGLLRQFVVPRRYPVTGDGVTVTPSQGGVS